MSFLFLFCIDLIQIQPRLWFDNVGAGQPGRYRVKEGISLYWRETSEKGKTSRFE